MRRRVDGTSAVEHVRQRTTAVDLRSVAHLRQAFLAQRFGQWRRRNLEFPTANLRHTRSRINYKRIIMDLRPCGRAGGLPLLAHGQQCPILYRRMQRVQRSVFRSLPPQGSPSSSNWKRRRIMPFPITAGGSYSTMLFLHNQACRSAVAHRIPELPPGPIRPHAPPLPSGWPIIPHRRSRDFRTNGNRGLRAQDHGQAPVAPRSRSPRSYNPLHGIAVW